MGFEDKGVGGKEEEGDKLNNFFISMSLGAKPMARRASPVSACVKHPIGEIVKYK